jgi:methenyltetrahydrofolate cyclohydrolase
MPRARISLIVAFPTDTSPDAPQTAHLSPSLGEYLDALASDAPAPGGGSATGLTGALGAALISMVANFTVGRPEYAGMEAQVQATLAEADELRARLIRLMRDDERAFGAAADARKLPHTTPSERSRRNRTIERMTKAAAQSPLEMASVCRRLLELSRTVAEAGNPHLASDAGVAALLAEAALRASAINARVNLARLRDRAFVDRTEAQLNALVEGSPTLKEEVLAIAGRRMAGG